jgi:hypothetical protein
MKGTEAKANPSFSTNMWSHITKGRTRTTILSNRKVHEISGCHRFLKASDGLPKQGK